MQDKNRNAGVYDRRVDLLKPNEVSTARFNEEQVDFLPVYTNYPAKRMDSGSTEDEKESGNLVTGSALTIWRLRFIPGLDIKTTWKLKDLFDEKIYQIVEPATEIGRQEAIRVVTKLVQ